MTSPYFEPAWEYRRRKWPPRLECRGRPTAGAGNPAPLAVDAVIERPAVGSAFLKDVNCYLKFHLSDFQVELRIAINIKQFLKMNLLREELQR